MELYCSSLAKGQEDFAVEQAGQSVWKDELHEARAFAPCGWAFAGRVCSGQAGEGQLVEGLVLDWYRYVLACACAGSIDQWPGGEGAGRVARLGRLCEDGCDC